MAHFRVSVAHFGVSAGDLSVSTTHFVVLTGSHLKNINHHVKPAVSDRVSTYSSSLSRSKTAGLTVKIIFEMGSSYLNVSAGYF